MKRTKLKVLTVVCLSTMLLSACGGAHEHTYVEHAAVDATCEKAGNKKYYTCSAESCKDKFFDADKKETTWDQIKINALGHTIVSVAGKAATCTEDGYKAAFQCSRCNLYFEDQKGETKIGDATAYTTWKTTGAGKIAKEGHKVEKVPGKAATCTEDGYKDAWKCSTCNHYFEDAEQKTEIGDVNAYTTWKTTGAGKIAKEGHKVEKVDGKVETCTEDGYKDAWKCSTCNLYFEDAEQKTEIGDETAYTAWKTGAGKITKHAHTFGELIPESEPSREDDGLKKHYRCSECEGYFDENQKSTTHDDLVTDKRDLGRFEFDETYASEEGVKLPDISKDDILVVDVKLATPVSAPARIDFAVAEGWDNYAGRFEIIKNTNGVYSTVSQYSGVSVGTTKDGYCRVYINLAKVTKGQNLDQITKFDLLMVKAADTSKGEFEQVKGEISVVPSLKIANTEVKRGYTLNCTSWTYLVDEKWSHALTEKIYIDYKFEEGNTQNLALVLYDGWDNYSQQFELTPDGTILWQKPGAQVVKVADQDGFVGGYYRLIIDLSYHASWTNQGTLTKVNRVAIKNTGANVTIDVDPINCLEHDAWYTLKGSTESDTKIDLYTYNPVTIRDGSGNLLDKALYFEVSAQGGDPESQYGSEVKFALMDGNSKNCSSVTLFFKSSALVEAKFWGGAGSNAWGTITDLGNNKYGITINLAKLPGGDIAKSSKIDYYNGAGIIKAGVTSFSLNLDSFKLVEKIK